MGKYERFTCFAPDKPVITWHVDDLGYRWKKPPQGNNALIELSDEGRLFTPDGVSWVYGFPDTAPIAAAEYDVHWASKVLTLEAGSAVGPVAHWETIDAADTVGYVLQHTGSGQSLELVRPGAGAIWSAPLVVAAGDLFWGVWKIRETASSVDHEIWANGSLLGSYSDTDAARVTGGGHVGIRMHDAASGQGVQPTYLAVITAAVAEGAPDAASPPAAVSLSIVQESQQSHTATISGGSGRTRWELHRSSTPGFTPDRTTYDTLVLMVDDGATTTGRAWTRSAVGHTSYYKAVAVNDAGVSISAEVAITHQAPVYPPTFARLNGGAPVFTEADVPTTTIYWPKPNTNAALIALQGKKYTWFWSTDHGGGGLYMGTSSDLICTDFAVVGAVWAPGSIGAEWSSIETPFYVYNPDDPNGRPHYLYYQAANLGELRQQSFLISSADLATWVDEGAALPNTAEWVHTGYMKPVRFGPGDWGSISLLIGGPNGKSGYWTSADGKNWTLVEQVDNWTMLRDIGKNFGGLAEKIDYAGHQWAISSMQDPGEAGSTGNPGDIVATMEVVDNVTYVGEVREILLPTLGESGNANETSNIRFSAPYVEGSEIYLIYATDEVSGSGEPYSVFVAQAGEVALSAPTISINQGAASQREIGQTLQLTVSTTGIPAPSVSYSSDDTGIATVSAGGLVTPLSVGTARITATATNSEGSASDFIDVTVVAVGAPAPLSDPYSDLDYWQPGYAVSDRVRRYYAIVRSSAAGQSVSRTFADVPFE